MALNMRRARRFCRPSPRAAARSSTAKPISMPATPRSAMPTTGTTTQRETRLQPQSFYYVGGNVGGPIFFPHFNHNRDKLFFWAGYEYMDQHPYNAPVEMNVPTPTRSRATIATSVVDPNVIKTYRANYTLPCSNAGGMGCKVARTRNDFAMERSRAGLQQPVGLLRPQRQNHQRPQSSRRIRHPTEPTAGTTTVTRRTHPRIAGKLPAR